MYFHVFLFSSSISYNTVNNGVDVSKLGEALKFNRSLIKLKVYSNFYFNYFLINFEDSIEIFEKALESNICLLDISDSESKLLQRNEEIQTNLSKRIFECKNPHLSLLDYKILQRVNVAVIFENVWNLQQSQQTIGKPYEQSLREYWELISNGFPKRFLTILGVCKLNQTSPSRAHLLGIPTEILSYIGSFLNPKDFNFSIDANELEAQSRRKKKQRVV